MSKTNVSIIAAIVGENRVLGKNGDLVVRISDDLKRFKTLTTGHAIIMGRKTYESLGRPLPNRQNIVVTHNLAFNVPGIVVCGTLEEALKKASEYENTTSHSNKEIFIIGGGEIYKQGLTHSDKLYLTVVENEAEGDVFFPDYSEFKKVVSKEDRIDEKTGQKYSWIDLTR